MHTNEPRGGPSLDANEPVDVSVVDDTGRHRPWATQALAATGLSLWRWVTPDAFCRSQTPSPQGAGLRDETTIGFRSLLRAMAPRERSRLANQWRHVAWGHSDRLDVTLQPDAGDPHTWWRVRGTVTRRAPQGRPSAALGVWEAVAAPGRHDASSRVRAHAFVASRDPMLVVDERWHILEANDAFTELGGARLSGILGQRLQRYVEADALRFAPSTIADNDRTHHHEGVFHAGCELHIPIELTLSDFTLDDDGDVHYIAALRDISARKRSERELEHLASIDTLTQLPNRATLQYTLKRQLLRVTPHTALAVLFIDLDGFKHINDSLGHQAGDALLRIMVKRLRATLRSKDLVARWGGDEFVVIIDVGRDSQLADKIAQRLLEALSQPMVIGGHQISVTASIGLVHAPADGRDSETLLKHADVAMYAAKDKGKNTVVAYHDKLKHHNLEQMSMLSQLREAITKETLDFVVQPKFDGHNRVIGAEILARWSTTDYGQVPPSTFVPLAEHNGMASLLGNLAIEHAARCAARLAADGHPLPVAVNISALHVMDESLAETLHAACRRHAITTDQIELEVTESVFLENTRAPEARIEHLRRQGFRVAMDDFGSGYSSLGYLKRLPFDTIKIDRSFMKDLEADIRSRHLLAGIVGLCNLLGMETVAEGVETLEQWQLLQELGVKQYQGYYLGRPMGMEQLLERLTG
ncbi:putative bifunctional diguanylate cyclase/phosphodiesterase [Salinicola peritrichatus]|uniref:putative bifunctional diguanylate cyclase/phosphodiesterase n=1 Tax=Salinicola peritrichatus TaxID=1267424 RepID=UPI000DA1FBF7|nr:GGDEF and EAL domain-containing protein [Salinicola peritrichatus]